MCACGAGGRRWGACVRAGGRACVRPSVRACMHACVYFRNRTPQISHQPQRRSCHTFLDSSASSCSAAASTSGLQASSSSSSFLSSSSRCRICSSFFFFSCPGSVVLMNVGSIGPRVAMVRHLGGKLFEAQFLGQLGRFPLLLLLLFERESFLLQLRLRLLLALFLWGHGITLCVPRST